MARSTSDAFPHPQPPSRKHSPRRGQASRTIGIFVDSFYDSYEATIFSGIEAYLRGRGVRLLYFNGGAIKAPHYLHTKKNAVFQLADKANIHGLIVVSSSLGSYISRNEMETFCNNFRDIPLVSIGTEIKNHASVIVDNYGGVSNLLAHLIEVHGYRRLAFISGPKNNVEAEIRFKAYREILAAHDIPFDKELVFTGTFFGFSGEKAVHTFLNERKVTFEAVVATNDLVAMQVMHALKNRNISVPDDAAVVGFDNIGEGRNEPFLLTTVSQPEFELGYRAAENLLTLLSGETIETRLVLPTELIVRSSCGCDFSRKAGENRREKAETQVYSQIMFPPNAKWPLMQRKEREFEIFLISQSLLTILEIASLKKIIKESFPSLGIKSCYISIFQNNRGNKPFDSSRLLLAYKDYALNPSNKQEVAFFPTKDLLPNGLEALACENPFIIMTLFFKDEQLGFVIYESENPENDVFEILTIQLSNALKGVMLYDTLKTRVDALRLNTPRRPHEAEKYRKLRLPREKSEEYFRRLLEQMDKHAIYKNADLTLPRLSDKLGIPRNHLSYVINKYAGLRFYDFLNTYRVEEAKRLLLTPNFTHQNILTAAYDSGFKSKSTFNKLFKKYTDQTPSAFLRTHGATMGQENISSL